MPKSQIKIKFKNQSRSISNQGFTSNALEKYKIK